MVLPISAVNLYAGIAAGLPYEAAQSVMQMGEANERAALAPAVEAYKILYGLEMSRPFFELLDEIESHEQSRSFYQELFASRLVHASLDQLDKMGTLLKAKDQATMNRFRFSDRNILGEVRKLLGPERSDPETLKEVPQLESGFVDEYVNLKIDLFLDSEIGEEELEKIRVWSKEEKIPFRLMLLAYKEAYERYKFRDILEEKCIALLTANIIRMATEVFEGGLERIEMDNSSLILKDSIFTGSARKVYYALKDIVREYEISVGDYLIDLDHSEEVSESEFEDVIREHIEGMKISLFSAQRTGFPLKEAARIIIDFFTHFDFERRRRVFSGLINFYTYRASIDRIVHESETSKKV
ncbi:MAG: hypothetical protein A3F82_07700 [Deltaproteobacteria bacterium RIFCSPLOWO2_12_FULL_44_12]|nr:MAG: hypothetical protein A2979_00910 [Deltaproteobacteria bacterium RIFCSPLOWO2_01_FULL_45_74]OGQ71047.1 MAG: hypothetical protein A3F82_07700 [Deltaproteobacteria bacterium RIFCSPLOWO2_12_FULL_44_12]